MSHGQAKGRAGDGGGGRCFVVGLGPGGLRHLTPAAREAIEAAQVVVGYTTYVELIRGMIRPEQTVLALDLGQELERARLALERAASGHTVAVVSSGDAGLYGMAGPVYEVLAADRTGAFEEVAVEVIPGVPALMAAAARLGAPLMNDFCAVSLSDLLTPREVICRRVEAACQGDFVVCLYNPASRRRTEPLREAWELLLRYRAAATPVGVVRAATRPGEAVAIVELSALGVRLRAVDMLTLLIVGNSQTVVAQGKMVTPRGYDRKYDLERPERAP